MTQLYPGGSLCWDIATEEMFSYHGLSNFQPGAEGIRADLRCWCFSTAATFICSLVFRPPQILHSFPGGGQQGVWQHSLVQEENHKNFLKCLFSNYYMHMKQGTPNFIANADKHFKTRVAAAAVTAPSPPQYNRLLSRKLDCDFLKWNIIPSLAKNALFKNGGFPAQCSSEIIMNAVRWW